MLITIEKVLTPEQVKITRVKLATAQWTDGSVTQVPSSVAVNVAFVPGRIWAE